MKKFFIITAAIMLSVAVYSQDKSVKFDQNVRNVVYTANMNDLKTGYEAAPALPINPSRSTKVSPMFLQELEVGRTQYDLQSNSGLSNRFFHYDDGTIGATWTGGVESAPSFPDRGSFYNYFNGTVWTVEPEDVTRVENERRGWPSYCGDYKGGEYLASHSPLALYHRDVKGEGEWSEIANPIVEGDESTWPRLLVNPETGTIHIVSAIQNKIGEQYENTIVYSRSKDGGKSWFPAAEPFTELEANYSKVAYSADDYIWATPRNGVIAFALLTPTADAIIMKSTDDGETWERIVVWQHPIPMFDYYTMIYTDTCMSPTGAGALVIDENGMCHLFFAVCNTLFAETGGGYNYFPLWGNMVYWNEDMDTYEGYEGLECSEDYETFLSQLVCEVPISYGFCFNGDASAVGGGGLEVVSYYRTFGPARFISAELAGPNRIICAVSSWDERRETPNPAFIITQIYLCSYSYNEDEGRWRLDEEWIQDPNMSGYLCAFTMGGQPIEYPYNGWFRMNNDYLHNYDECVYPQVVVQYSQDERANFYVFYNLDELAGLALDGESQTEYCDNTIMMYYNDRMFKGGNLPEIDLDGIDNKGIANSSHQMKLYPNPTSETINISMDENADVTIYDLLGKKVHSFRYNGGIMNINVSSLSEGVYFMVANNGRTTETQKFIVK